MCTSFMFPIFAHILLLFQHSATSAEQVFQTFCHRTLQAVLNTTFPYQLELLHHMQNEFL